MDLIERLEAKAAQLQNYRATLEERQDEIGKHARAVADGRYMQIHQVIGWLKESATNHSKLSSSP